MGPPSNAKNTKRKISLFKSLNTKLKNNKRSDMLKSCYSQGAKSRFEIDVSAFEDAFEFYSQKPPKLEKTEKPEESDENARRNNNSKAFEVEELAVKSVEKPKINCCILKVESKETKNKFDLCLKGDWANLEIKNGIKINLIRFKTCKGDEKDFISPISNGSEIVVDGVSPFCIVLCPDILLNSTEISTSFDCLRKTVLSILFKTPGMDNKKALLGCLAHELFQASLREKNFSFSFIKKNISTIIKTNLSGMYALNMSEKETEDNLHSYIPKIAQWGPRFLRKTPLPSVNRKTPRVCVPEIVEIEELCCSTVFGLKGKIDANVKLRKENKHGGMDTSFSALEIKSGSDFNSHFHHAQVAIYSALLADKYKLENIPEGLLYYLSKGNMSLTKGAERDLKAIMLRRNEVLPFLTKREVPSMIKRPATCSRCYERDKCLVYRKAEELTGRDATEICVPQLYNELSSFVDKKSAEYLTRWKEMIDSEEEANKETKESFIGALKLISTKPSNYDEKENEFDAYMGENGTVECLFGKICCENETVLYPGTRVAISEEGESTKLMNGVVFVTNGLIRNVNFGTKRDGKSDKKIEIVVACKGEIFYRKRHHSAENALYRISVEKYRGAASLLRSNVVNLFTNATNKSNLNFDLIRKIVLLENPRFTPNSLAPNLSPELAKSFYSLNPDQKTAVEKVFSAKDYALIFGMPGTGKSTVIAFILCCIAEMKQRALVVAYTHSALNHLLLKLKKFGVPFIRAGRNKKTEDKELQESYLETLESHSKTVEEFRKKIESIFIIGTTTLSVSSPFIKNLKIDFCIVDEASQMSEAACIGPLRLAKRFILVGDHRQLRPLVRSSKAASLGMGKSLFQRLFEKFPESAAVLKTQYRMNEELQNLSNVLFYGNRLQSGSERVSSTKFDPFGIGLRNKKIPTPFPSCLDPKRQWVYSVFDPLKSAVFVDTDSVNGRECYLGSDVGSEKAIVNKMEVKAVKEMIETILKFDQSPLFLKKISVLSTYRSQTDFLKKHLKQFIRNGVNVSTVDQFQGRESDCVILSLVRANERNAVGELLKDWRRLNVAVTRAKTKLIFVGSRKTLRSAPLMKRVFDHFEGRNRIIPLSI